jgi:hypothetical protein
LEGTGAHPALILRIGEPGSWYWDVEQVSDSDFLTYSWDPTILPAGTVRIQAVAYDLNNNRGEVNLRVNAEGSGGSTPGGAPEVREYYLEAMTFGQSLNLLLSKDTSGTEAKGSLPGGFARSTPGLHDLSPSSRDGIRAAPVGSTAVVLVEASARAGTTGMNVYTSTNGSSYSLRARVTHKETDDNDYYPDSEYYAWVDTSSSLTPGNATYYKLAYFNASGEGGRTPRLALRILPTYTLTLTSPQENAVITDTAPTLQWSATTINSAYRWDEAVVWEASTGDEVYSHEDYDYAAVRTPILDVGVLYEWNVYSLYIVWGANDSIVSVSYPTTSGSSNNGSWCFTIGR